jgi:hypothetical protein
MCKVKNIKYKLKELYDIKEHQYNLYINIHPYFVLPIYHSGMNNYTLASALYLAADTFWLQYLYVQVLFYFNIFNIHCF